MGVCLPFTRSAQEPNAAVRDAVGWDGGTNTTGFPKSPFSMNLCHPALVPPGKPGFGLYLSQNGPQFCSVQAEPDGDWAGSSLIYLGVPLSFHSCSRKGTFLWNKVQPLNKGAKLQETGVCVEIYLLIGLGPHE